MSSKPITYTYTSLFHLYWENPSYLCAWSPNPWAEQQWSHFHGLMSRQRWSTFWFLSHCSFCTPEHGSCSNIYRGNTQSLATTTYWTAAELNINQNSLYRSLVLLLFSSHLLFLLVRENLKEMKQTDVVFQISNQITKLLLVFGNLILLLKCILTMWASYSCLYLLK